MAVGVLSAATTVGVLQFTQNQDQNNEDLNYFQSKNKNAQFASMNSSTVGSDFSEIAKAAVPAVVAVKNYQTRATQRNMDQDLFDFFFGDPFGNTPRRQQQQQQVPKNIPAGLGSGVIISPNGYIITNNHVVQGAEKLEIELTNRKNYIATLVGTDPSSDIALLKIDAEGLPYLNFANSDNAQVGEWVLAIGNPMGLSSTVTAGIISAKGRSIDILSQNSKTPIESFIQTDAAINKGNSGGALVDSNGNLVGINSAISSATGYYEGYGFAVPSNLAKKVVEDIKKYGLVQRAFLGVSALDLANEMLVKQYNFQNKTDIKSGNGVYVLETTEDSSARNAGLKKGDIITNIDGTNIESFADLSLTIGRKRPGDTAKITYFRGGKQYTTTATLRDQSGHTDLRNRADLTATEKLGADFQELTDKQKVYFGINNGVVAVNVSASGLLASISVQEGNIILEINGKAVNSQKDIDRILKGHKGQVGIKYLDNNGRLTSRGFTMR